jgi:hypothetical protein
MTKPTLAHTRQATQSQQQPSMARLYQTSIPQFPGPSIP